MKRSLIVAGAFVTISWTATAWARRKRVRGTLADALLDLVSTKGRLSRRGFWLHLLCAAVLSQPAQASRPMASSGAIAFVALAACQCASWIFIAALVRRFRDVNLSGSWTLLLAGVMVGFVLVGEATCSPLLSAVGPLLFGGTIGVIGIADGTVGRSRFGLDPLESIVCQPEDLESPPRAARCRLLRLHNDPSMSSTRRAIHGQA